MLLHLAQTRDHAVQIFCGTRHRGQRMGLHFPEIDENVCLSENIQYLEPAANNGIGRGDLNRIHLVMNGDIVFLADLFNARFPIDPLHQGFGIGAARAFRYGNITGVRKKAQKKCLQNGGMGGSTPLGLLFHDEIRLDHDLFALSKKAAVAALVGNDPFNDLL